MAARSSFLCFALHTTLLLLLQHFNLSTAQTFVLLFNFTNCNDDTFDPVRDYKPNSPYAANLNLLFSSISNNRGNNSRHYAGSVGNGSDTVHGVFQCRYDLAPEDCQKCAQTAALDVQVRCPNNKEMSIWYDECFLHYSNRATISSLVDKPMLYFPYAKNVSDPALFTSKQSQLMNGLATQASNNATAKFATGEINVTSGQQIYGLVQCTQDLSNKDCAKCLATAISRIPDCCEHMDAGRVLAPSCIVWFEIYNFFESGLLSSLPSLPNTADTNKHNTNGNFMIFEREKSRKHVIIKVVLALSALAVLFISIIGFFFLRKNKGFHMVEGAEQVSTIESLKFNLGTLLTATDNFSESNLLGQGGFGSVYKGRILNGREIAVKRLSATSGQGVEEFKNEVLLLAKLEHRNLVRLSGLCLEGNEKLLVYEYMQNASLDKFIFDPIKRAYLDWERRYNIIQGIARGLLYLHADAPHRIIHRDLKASNILLDTNMNPKIADFGLARLSVVDETQGRTSQVVGTHGYMAPEYLLHGHYSVKSDVFSFGVLVLEIVTGQRNRTDREGEHGQDLISYAWRQWEQGSALALLEPTLRKSYSRNEVMQCIHLGLSCVQDDEARRPTMASIVLMLNSYSFTLPTLSTPGFFNRAGREYEMIRDDDARVRTVL